MEAIKYKLPVKDTEGNTVEEKELVLLSNTDVVEDYNNSVLEMNMYADYLGLPKSDGTLPQQKLEIPDGFEKDYLHNYNQAKQIVEVYEKYVPLKQEGFTVEDVLNTLITHFSKHNLFPNSNNYEIIRSLKLALFWTKESI